MSRRQLLAGGGIAAAAAAGGWFVFLRGDDGDGGSGLTSPDSPGQSYDDAPQVPDGEHGPYEITDGEQQYFAVDLEQGDSLEATIDFTHADGDLDLTLYDSNQTEIDSSTSVTDNETVSVSASEAGTYYINPYGFAGATNSYDLVVSID